MKWKRLLMLNRKRRNDRPGLPFKNILILSMLPLRFSIKKGTVRRDLPIRGIMLHVPGG